MQHSREISSRFAPLASNVRAAQTWGGGGRGYEVISRQIANIIEHCIDRLDPQRGERILDVATGTGWAARRVARRGAECVGVDFAAGVLEVARDLAMPGTSFAIADAEALPYEDGEFDAVLSTFGVMFCANPEAAASEIARVCRPGGRMALAVWPAHGGVHEMFKVLTRFVQKPGPSPFAWAETEQLERLFGHSFDIAVEDAVSYYREPDGASAWQSFVNGYGPIRTVADSLSASDRMSLERAFVELHEEYRTPLGVLMPRPYRIVVGRRR
ncbi:MAG: methyltransferase domain-containing protein [Planctomycetes bacterium]|nr:methyltransferase domain-containing protein [Planctomycetota bacterium]MCB9917094.1 methyltransferase domain-containing protein [Planctomycetota bacterium]